MPGRLQEIDALRGIAILAMIVFHGAFAALILRMIDFEPYGWPLIIFVRLVQFLFLGLMGVSVHFSSRRMRGQLMRALGLGAVAVGISLTTWIVFPEEFVKFGVIHFAAFAIPLVRLLKGHPCLALCFLVLSWAFGAWFGTLTVQTHWLFPFGLAYPGFASLDYFPLFPWLAVPLGGLLVGEWLYPEKKATRLKVLGKIPGLSFLGRHSLAIYLLHPPALYFTLLWLSS